MNGKDLGSVAVIGAGTMGSDVALLFAISGFDVLVIENSEKVFYAESLDKKKSFKKFANR